MRVVFNQTYDEESVYIKLHREQDRHIIRGKEVRGTMLQDYRKYFVPSFNITARNNGYNIHNIGSSSTAGVDNDVSSI